MGDAAAASLTNKFISVDVGGGRGN